MIAQVALKYGGSGRRNNNNERSGRGRMITFLPTVGRRQRRQLYVTLVFASISFYFAYHLVSGNKGLLAMMQLSSKLEEAHLRLDDVKMDRLKMEHKVKMLSPESLDLDLLDEQARRNLGHAKPNEIIYFLPEEEKQ